MVKKKVVVPEIEVEEEAPKVVEKQGPDLTPPKSCINCGQNTIPVDVSADEEGNVTYSCQLCKHKWTPEHEKAPFRQPYTTANPSPVHYGDWPEKPDPFS